MKYFIPTIGILLLSVIVSQVFIAKRTSNSGTVPYMVIQKYENFEIRQYPELIVATTNLSEGNYSSNSRLGFKRIASYIFGDNSDAKRIAMTSPVQMKIRGMATMSFFMPSDIDKNELPKPDNKKVVITTQKQKKVAALKFSGWASDAKLEENFIELKKLLDSQKIAYSNDYTYLGYNPPFQLINRLNEVLIEVNI